MKNLFDNKVLKLNSKLFFVLIALLYVIKAHSQYTKMDDFTEVGAGNYFIHLDKETEVKKVIQDAIKANAFPLKELVFNKGKNLFFTAYYNNPQDKKFTYFIYAEKAREGYDVYFLYIENTYHFFFDYHEAAVSYKLIFDPEKHHEKSLTCISGELKE